MPKYVADGTKQVAGPLPENSSDRITSPTRFTVTTTPNYITGSVLVDYNGPIKLDISPTAWSQTNAAGTIGDITFVYVRVS